MEQFKFLEKAVNIVAPIVSVRIPSYNHEKYIHDCISSILNQTFQDFEIVIVDDASTDASVSIIKQFKDPRIKLEVLERNSGMNVAVERCLRMCVGKYVANISSDDTWELTKLEKQVKFLENNLEYDAVFTQVNFIGEEGGHLYDEMNKYREIFDYENRSPEEWLRRFFYKGNCLCNPSVMIRREVYKELDYQDKRLISLSDFDLWIRFSMNHSFWILEEKLTNFRIRDEDMNLSADTPSNRNRGTFEHKQILDNYLIIRETKILVDIFPECLNFGEPVEALIPYLIGRLAIDSDSTILRLWGSEKIFKLMEDARLVETLDKYYNFRYVDFHKLMKTTDFFQTVIIKPSTQIAINEVAEYEEKNETFAHKPRETINQRVYIKIKALLRAFSPRLFQILKNIYLKTEI